MTDLSNRPDGPNVQTPPADPPIRRRWQIGMRTLFLLICAVAVWLGVVMNREKTRAMQARLDVIRSLARELEVEDPARIAIVKKQDQWMDEDRWDLYLPEGSYRICMATREVGDTGFAPVIKSVPIAPGRHRLALDQRTQGKVWRAVLTCDGSEQLTIEEPETFTGDSSTNSNEVSISEQFPPERPVVLSRRQFSDSKSGVGSGAPNGKSDGLMVWIEPDPGAQPPR